MCRCNASEAPSAKNTPLVFFAYSECFSRYAKKSQGTPEWFLHGMIWACEGGSAFCMRGVFLAHVKYTHEKHSRVVLARGVILERSINCERALNISRMFCLWLFSTIHWHSGLALSWASSISFLLFVWMIRCSPECQFLNDSFVNPSQCQFLNDSFVNPSQCQFLNDSFVNPSQCHFLNDLFVNASQGPFLNGSLLTRVPVSELFVVNQSVSEWFVVSQSANFWMIPC